MMKRIDYLVMTLVLGLSVIAATAIMQVTSWHRPQTVAAAPLQQGASVTPHVYLVIATGDMLGTNDMPAYIPSAFTLPAHSDVTITVTNFDDATALPPALAQAKGIVGKIAVQALDPKNPNGDAPVRLVSSMDPNTGVSHTFTITRLGINVPIAPKSRTTFTIHTGGAGTFSWQCFDPCGAGSTGWGGAMAQAGYMQGKVTVA